MLECHWERRLIDIDEPFDRINGINDWRTGIHTTFQRDRKGDVSNNYRTNAECRVFRRKEVPWEVVNSRTVDAVPMYYEDEDLDVAVMGESDTRGTYVFEVHSGKKAPELRKAVEFSRQQLLQEIIKKGYNILVLEGQVTHSFLSIAM
ncbi:hypothetical protein DXG01_000024 [Tephrocybe rancida]|nr:hypothetical protein DXG01_000024 [Tephrocybe rancida]